MKGFFFIMGLIIGILLNFGNVLFNMAFILGNNNVHTNNASKNNVISKGDNNNAVR